VSAATLAEDPGYAVIVLTMQELASHLQGQVATVAHHAIVVLNAAEQSNHAFAEPLIKAGEQLVLHPDQPDDCARLSDAERVSTERDEDARTAGQRAIHAMRALVDDLRGSRATGQSQLHLPMRKAWVLRGRLAASRLPVMGEGDHVTPVATPRLVDRARR
jgi:hypothetical protein